MKVTSENVMPMYTAEALKFAKELQELPKDSQSIVLSALIGEKRFLAEMEKRNKLSDGGDGGGI